MPLTNATAVQGILLGNYTPGADLSGFIEIAANMVTQMLDCATGKGVTISATTAELIERNLAAHYYGHGDQFFQSKSTKGASGSFQGQTGKGLEGSQYGQTAMMLDPSGCLSAMNKGGRIQMQWLGRNTQTPFVNRS